jgi:hypothetical protein
LTRKDVISVKIHLGHIQKIYDLAKIAGYDYFEWNGWVYKTQGAIKTDIETKDLK